MRESFKYERAAEIYKVLANAKRLSILHALDKKELSVDELTKKLKLRKSNVSQHLAILRHAKLVKMRRDATKVYYKITNPKIFESCVVIQNFSNRAG